jgi:hypothetical protein
MANVNAAEFKSNSNDLGQFITRPEDLASKILEWKSRGFHVLSPAIQVSSFAPGYAVNASLVVFDPTVEDNGRGLDVYFDKNTMKVHERAPSKIGLGRLAAAAGVSWVGPQSGRRDPLTIQNLWIYQIVGVYLAFDGTPQTIQGEKEIDYRDGSAQIGGWTPADWRELLAKRVDKPHINGWTEARVRSARMNGAERAETGAWERAMRAGFGIKHAYTVEELQRPFVALRFCSVVDMTDPAVRALVTQNQLAGVAALYAGTAGGRGRLSLATPADVIDISTRREPVSVGASSTVQPPAPTVPTPKPETSAAERPQVQTNASATPQVELPSKGVTPANFVKKVDQEPKPYGKNHAKAGQTFIKYHVIDGNGQDHVTIKSSLAKKAIDARDAQAPVVIVSALNSFKEMEISDIRPFESQQPTLPAEGFKL